MKKREYEFSPWKEKKLYYEEEELRLKNKKQKRKRKFTISSANEDNRSCG